MPSFSITAKNCSLRTLGLPVSLGEVALASAESAGQLALGQPAALAEEADGVTGAGAVAVPADCVAGLPRVWWPRTWPPARSRQVPEWRPERFP